MCGIVAFCTAEPADHAEGVTAALRSLAHRGPDGQGTWLDPAGLAALGHARLSIIDLETGGQPLANEDGELRLVVNGEFYGYEAIRADLAGRGHRLRTRTDSEILLHLYEEHGTACLHHLRGEFAFALWDARRRRLFAARDRFGIKPLFFARTAGGMRLASEAKALLAAGHPARWDREAFHQSVQGLASPFRSLFEGIRPLPPGHFLVAEAGQVRVEPYWDFDHARAEDLEDLPESDRIEAFRATLEESVRIRLRADVPVGIYLSGGLDSSAIAGIAARQVPDLQAYSVFFPEDPAHDESSVIRETAAGLGLRLHALAVDSAMVAEHLPAAVAQWEDLPKSEWVVGKYLLSRLVREAGGKVVLTGEGPDEYLGGHLVLARDARPPAPAGEEAPLAGVCRRLGFAPSFLVFRSLAAQRVRPLLSPGFLGEFDGRDPLTELLDGFDLARQTEGREPLTRSLYVWSRTLLPNFFLAACGDRSEMAHGVEGRVPYLDHLLVEQAARLPAALKVRGTQGKHILREAARPFVSERVYAARKKGFVTQPSRISQPGSPLRTLLQDTLRGPALAASPFYDRTAVLGLLDAQDRGRAPGGGWDEALLSVLGACLLQEAYRLS